MFVDIVKDGKTTTISSPPFFFLKKGGRELFYTEEANMREKYALFKDTGK